MLEEVCLALDLMSAVAEDIDSGGADPGVICFEEVFKEGFADLV